MEYLIWFLIYFVAVFLLYYIFVVRRIGIDKESKKPSEVSYLINVYKLDIDKFSYRKFLTTIGLMMAFDLSIVATFIPMIKEFIFQILFGFIIIIPVVVITFMIIGNYYKKKEKKDNSKELEKEKKYIEKITEKNRIKEERKNKRRDKNVK